jgi:methylglutaconyl-CoA hydratase
VQQLKQEIKASAAGIKGLYLTINRPEKANALTAELLSAIQNAFESVPQDSEVRYVVLQGSGKHFCAGADLEWMQESAGLDRTGNLKEAKRLSDMFKAISQCPVPTIALAKGRVYGGAVGLVASCDIALADSGAVFCLSEARLGIIPAVIAPYLLQRLSVSRVRELSITTRELSASNALNAGLVDHVGDLSVELEKQIGSLKKSSPSAIALMKNLLSGSLSESDCQEVIADARSSDQGKSGLKAFFDKASPPWNV